MVSMSAWLTHQEGLHQTDLLVSEVSSDPFCTNCIISSYLLVGVLKEWFFFEYFDGYSCRKDGVNTRSFLLFTIFQSNKVVSQPLAKVSNDFFF